NGAATFDIFINNGALFVQLDSLEVRGNPVPDEAMMQMRNENLLRNVRDPNLQRIVDNLESIQIEGDTLTVVPKNAAPAPTPEAPAPDVQPEESVSAPAEQPVEPEPAP